MRVGESSFRWANLVVSTVLHCESRLNLAGMLSQLEYLGTMSSLHKMVNFILKMTLHMVSFAIFRAFCYILASKVLKIAREIQT